MNPLKEKQQLFNLANEQHDFNENLIFQNSFIKK